MARTPHNDKKRKWGGSAKMQHGSRNKSHGMGRKDYYRHSRDKRGEMDEAPKRRKLGNGEQEQSNNKKPSTLPKPFPEEEVAAEERRPKHKVAVLIGYSGTGYRGMQINNQERTIEGELFQAFVDAGAISKANANDPKKSQLVRCARTDKGVHAAGNVISLKLIVEDADVVQKINSHLSPQIRVWGIQRTIGSFSSYQACDSRWYEYLIPTHSFLPPHPSSWLGKKLAELADEAQDREGFEERQKEVKDFWAETEERHIKPISDELPDDIKQIVQRALDEDDFEDGAQNTAGGESVQEVNPDNVEGPQTEFSEPSHRGGKDVKPEIEEPPRVDSAMDLHEAVAEVQEESSVPPLADEPNPSASSTLHEQEGSRNVEAPSPEDTEDPVVKARLQTLEWNRALAAATRRLRHAYITAKRAHRIPPARLARIQPILDTFIGTRNFHNYTIQKSFQDPSAKRQIKSFELNPEPIVINGTEWLSFKIHGQSFMMHQIRKMIAMIALVIRCGCDPSRINETFGNVRVNVPKVPGLGLLLERPVFDSYNSGRAEKFGREKIGFDKYEKVLEEFKRREIYERIFREEEHANAFNAFFGTVDQLRNSHYYYLSRLGFEAVAKYRRQPATGTDGEKKPRDKPDSEDEDEDVPMGEGGEG